jgi:DNA-binding PadR family transcriptional regulator
MISRLGYAILALLARQPSTGYELSARARRPLGYFWSARHSQIYPELRKLLAQGLVRFTAGPGPGPRAKKVYSVTEAGLAALREWVIQPPEPAPSRDDLVLKAYAAWTADPAAAGRLFAAQIAGHRERLAAYEADWGNVQGRHHGGAPPVTHPDFGNYATLRCGIDYERQRIGWLEWISQQFAAHAPGPSGDPAADGPGGPGRPA